MHVSKPIEMINGFIVIVVVLYLLVSVFLGSLVAQKFPRKYADDVLFLRQNCAKIFRCQLSNSCVAVALFVNVHL